MIFVQNNNLAYAIKQFEDIGEREAEKKVEIKKLTKTKKRPAQKSAWKLLFTVAYVCALCAALIYSKVELTEVNANLLELEDIMTEVESESVRLDLELQALISLKNVEDTAKNELGLSQTSQSQIEYISIKDENKAQIINEDTSYIEYIGQFFEGIKEYIAG